MFFVAYVAILLYEGIEIYCCPDTIKIVFLRYYNIIICIY